MRLAEFVSADPHMGRGEWRRELVAGELRTLSAPGPEYVLRTMQIAAALVAAVRRAKIDARVETGAGIGFSDEEADEYRVADVIVQQEDKRKRRAPTLVCLVTQDPASLGTEEADRVSVICRHPTVREVLIFAVTAPFVRIHRRLGDEWSFEDFEGMDERVPLRFGASLSLASVYEE